MKKLLVSTAVALGLGSAAGAASAEEIKLGVFLGLTGPIESIVTHMAPAAEAAMKEVTDSGKLLNGLRVVSVRADTTCIDAAAATAAMERLVTAEKVSGVIGGDCSGVTTAALTNVAVPNGMVMVSPSATSPSLSTVEDNGLFFRTAPSDARQGVVMTEIIMGRGFDEVAVTYTNNDYGKGLADAFQAAFEAKGGSVTAVAAHEDGKADDSAEVGALAAAGGELLVVAGYLDQGGKGMIQASLDSGAFDTFMLPDGMVGDSLTDAFGDALNGSFGTNPGTDSPGAKLMADITANADFDGTDPYVPECYDASALILLAMQSAGSTDSKVFKDHIMKVANGPGEKIYPGELAKALQILADGGTIDYEGGTAVNLIGPGEASGSFREAEIKGGKFETVMYH